MGNARIKNSGSRYDEKTKKSNRITTIGIISVALIFAICIGLIVISETGIVTRSKLIMSTANYKVNGSMYNYFFGTQYNSFLTYYSSYASYLGLDTSKPLSSQLCTMTTDDTEDTWLDYFNDMTTTQIKQYLIFCEGARAAGITLEKEEKDSIDESMQSIKDAAKENNYTTSGYITALYGAGVKESDLRDCFELVQLAAKYSAKLNEDYKNGATDELITKYFNDNITDFLTADYLSYSWSATKATVKEADYADNGGVEGEAYKAAVEKAEADYNAEKDKYKAYVETLKAATTADAFKTALRSIIYEIDYKESYDENFTTNLTKYKDENKDVSDEDATKAVEEALKKEVDESVDKKIEEALTEGAAYTISTDVGRWIFGTEVKNADADDEETEQDTTTDTNDTESVLPVPAAEVNTIFVDESTAKEEEDSGKYTVAVYFLVRASSRDESATKNVGHILISVTTDDDATEEEEKTANEEAKKKAEEILQQYLAGDKTKDSFEKIGLENTEDSSVFYEGIKVGDMVEDFNSWLFSLNDYKDEVRNIGDTGLVESEYGWHVMYYDGDGAAAWYEDSKNAYINDCINTWFEDSEKIYTVTTNEKNLSSLGY